MQVCPNQNDWKEPFSQTDENPMHYLSCQIDGKTIIDLARGPTPGNTNKLDARISDAEIFSLYAIMFAYRGLHELWQMDFNSSCTGDGWLNRYLAEADGFLNRAMHSLAEQKTIDVIREFNFQVHHRLCY